MSLLKNKNNSKNLKMLSEDSQGVVNYMSGRFKLDLTLKTKDLYEVAIGTKVTTADGAIDEVLRTWLRKDIEAHSLIVR